MTAHFLEALADIAEVERECASHVLMVGSLSDDTKCSDGVLKLRLDPVRRAEVEATLFSKTELL